MNSRIQIIDVTSANVAEQGIYCIKNPKLPGYQAKVEWFKQKINTGLRIKIAVDKNNKQIGFIEYIPSEIAWRPIHAKNYFFIQCIALFSKEAKEQGVGSCLIEQCILDAKNNNLSGVCAMSSYGPWMANKSLFEKNNFTCVDIIDRYELMLLSFDAKHKQPTFYNWTKDQSSYSGWHLLYSDQCPWHEKAISEIIQTAASHHIKLNVKKLSTPKEAQNAPSGFGTFSLLKDGKLLADHYISKTRFENIVKQESNLKRK